jgi:predicted site-specific integrase-resolvase
MRRELLTIEEAAQLAYVSVRTIRRWIANGHLTPTINDNGRDLFLNIDVYHAQRDASDPCKPKSLVSQ